MINYEHNDVWKRSFSQAIDTTFSFLNNFGIGETKDIPSLVSPEVKDESSSFHRFLEVFFDESLLDAEMSFAAEKAGNDENVYLGHAKQKKRRLANHHRFIDVIHASILYCRMSRDYGVDFAMMISEKLNTSFAHIGFLEEFYDSAMGSVRFSLLQEEWAKEDAGNVEE